jgi:hypothetical membrane protein
VGPLGGEKYNNSFDMNGGILVGGFFRIAFVLSMRKREKISETSGENPEVFIIR